MKVKSPLEVYRFLPATNCGDCKQPTCMAFASLMIARDRPLEECKPLLQPKFKSKYEELKRLLAPEIKQITIGVGETARRIGGEDVMYRHVLTFFNQPPLAYDVWDTMEENALVERVKKIAGFKKFYVGAFLTADMIAIRSTSNDPEKFAACVKKVMSVTNLPLILMSLNPAVLEAGLKVAADKRPLIYAATKDNWKQVAELVKKYNVPVTISAPGDLDMLASLAKTFLNMRIDDLVLDPGTYPYGKQLRQTFENFIKLRRAGIPEGQRDIAFPTMCIPMTVWLTEKNLLEGTYRETEVANIFTVKYADLHILHSLEPYSIIPIMYLRKNIYTDPRTPVQVPPGLKETGTPDRKSPVFVTTNFALTYYTVESDISSNNINSYIVVVDTGGLGVEPAVAGGQITASKVKDAVDASKVKEKVDHNTLVIPGLAARLKGDLEDATGMTIMVGPTDSGRIPGWMEKSWKK